ncbi:hypothetical protein BUZ24_12070, partial [Staphylococcus haemolyticus]
RPVARLYNTRDQSYQRVIKHLTDLLPKDKKPVETDEPFDDYVCFITSMWMNIFNSGVRVR